ncbi:MAG: acetyltransferase [Cyanobium sp.]
MFLKLTQHGEADGSLVEVLDFKALIDPFATSVEARIHGGEELQDPHHFAKAELSFPSGEALPRCWIDSHYRD